MATRQGFEPRPWSTVQKEIADVLTRVDPRSFDDVLACFADKKRRWFFSGQGRSGLVAQMAAMRFMHLGYDTHFVGEATAPAVRGGDGFLLVCGSGETPVSTSFAAIAKAEGAELVLVTRNLGSDLARMASVVLPVPTAETAQFGGSLFEQCGLILLDSLALQLAQRESDPQASMWRRHTNMQ